MFDLECLTVQASQVPDYLQVPDCPQVQGAKGLWLADKSGLSNANKGFPGGADRKESACNAEDLDSIPGLGRTTEEGNGYSLQYSGLENSHGLYNP